MLWHARFHLFPTHEAPIHSRWTNFLIRPEGVLLGELASNPEGNAELNQGGEVSQKSISACFSTLLSQTKIRDLATKAHHPSFYILSQWFLFASCFSPWPLVPRPSLSTRTPLKLARTERTRSMAVPRFVAPKAQPAKFSSAVLYAFPSTLARPNAAPLFVPQGWSAATHLVTSAPDPT